MNKQELLSVPVPSATSSYSPVSHKNVINEINENLYKNNLSVVKESYNTNKKGTQVIGKYDIKTNDNIFNFRISFRNSYDKTMSLAFVSGAEVMI